MDVQLSLSDLQEIDAERVGPLSCEQPRQLLGKTVANLIKAREGQRRDRAQTGRGG